MEPFKHTEPATTYYVRFFKQVVLLDAFLFLLWLVPWVTTGENDLFTLLLVSFSLLTLFSHRLVVSPAGISYWLMGSKIAARWSDVERIEAPSTKKSYLVFRTQLAKPDGLTQARVPKHLRGRAIPLLSAWDEVETLEQTIHHYAPQVLTVTGQPAGPESYGQPIAADQGLYVPALKPRAGRKVRVGFWVLVLAMLIPLGILAALLFLV